MEGRGGRGEGEGWKEEGGGEREREGRGERGREGKRVVRSRWGILCLINGY